MRSRSAEGRIVVELVSAVPCESTTGAPVQASLESVVVVVQTRLHADLDMCGKKYNRVTKKPGSTHPTAHRPTR